MGWLVKAKPWPLYPRERDPVRIVREAGWAPGPVWMGVENFALLGFEHRTVQPVASGYTDWAIPAHEICVLHTWIFPVVFCVFRRRSCFISSFLSHCTARKLISFSEHIRLCLTSREFKRFAWQFDKDFTTFISTQMFIDNIKQPRPHGSVSRTGSEMAVNSSDRISPTQTWQVWGEDVFVSYTRIPFLPQISRKRGRQSSWKCRFWHFDSNVISVLLSTYII